MPCGLEEEFNFLTVLGCSNETHGTRHAFEISRETRWETPSEDSGRRDRMGCLLVYENGGMRGELGEFAYGVGVELMWPPDYRNVGVTRV